MQTDRQTRQTETETDRQRQEQTGRQTDTHTNKQGGWVSQQKSEEVITKFNDTPLYHLF